MPERTTAQQMADLRRWGAIFERDGEEIMSDQDKVDLAEAHKALLRIVRRRTSAGGPPPRS